MKKAIIIVLAAMMAASVNAKPHRHAPSHPSHHSHHSRKSGGFAAGVVGGALVGGILYNALKPSPAYVASAPRPVYVPPPPPPPVPVYETRMVWVDGRYVDQVMPNGAVHRYWQPGHYEEIQVQVR